MQLLSNNFQWNQIVIALKERRDALRELESLAKRLRLYGSLNYPNEMKRGQVEPRAC